MNLGKMVLTWTEIHKYCDRRSIFLCDQLVERMAFNTADDNRWERSDIRRWLNGEFLESCFTNEERAKIIPLKQGGIYPRKRTGRECRSLLVVEKRWAVERSAWRGY